METRIKLSVSLLLFILMSSNAFAQSEVKHEGMLSPMQTYNDEVAIHKVAGVIELRDGATPAVNLDVELKNNSGKSKTLSAGFRASEASRVALKTRGDQVLRLQPNVMHKGAAGKVQMVNIDLALFLDGHLPGKPVAETDIKIVLPANTKKIIRSNRKLLLAQESGRNVYYLRQNGKYLSGLKIVYTTGPVLIDIRKEISPVRIKKGSVDVTLVVKNEGTQTANNLLLEDNYDPRDFSAEGAEFTLYKGEVNDARLIWRKVIPSLAAGQTKTITYRLVANYDVTNTKLSAATASISKELVGVSNKIRLNDH